jgi:hypothetical protein
MSTVTTGKPYNPLATLELPGGLRVFSNTKLQSAIDSAIASMSPDDHFVAVAHHVYNQNGDVIENVTKVSAVVRLPKGFSVAVAGYKDWAKGDLGGEAKAIWRPHW